MITLSTQKNIKPLNQLKSGFKRIVNWNKNLAKIRDQAQNRYLGFLVDPIFQGVNRLFVLSFEDEGWESRKQYYLPTVKIKGYNVMINDDIRKIVTGQGDDYITGCLLDYPYFKNYTTN